MQINSLQSFPYWETPSQSSVDLDFIQNIMRKSGGLQKGEIHPTLITNPILTPQVSTQKDSGFFYIMQCYELAALKTDCKVYTFVAKADLKINGRVTKILKLYVKFQYKWPEEKSRKLKGKTNIPRYQCIYLMCKDLTNLENRWNF